MPASLIVAGMAAQAEIDRDRIWSRKNAFRQQVRSFLTEYGESLEVSDKKKWEDALTELVNKVVTYRNEVTVKVDQVRPTVRMSEFEKETIRLQQETLAEQKRKSQQKEKLKKEEALAQAEAKLMAFKDDYNVLTVQMSADPTPYEERDDVVISTAMQDLQEW